MSIPDIEVKVVCPLGMNSCREIKNNEILQCAWYVQIAGKTPQSEEIINEWKCAMAWQPILMIENAQTNRGQTQAITMFRDAVLVQNEKMMAQIPLSKDIKFIEAEDATN